MSGGHKLGLGLVAAPYVALMGGLVGQAVWGGRVIQVGVTLFAWLRLGLEATRFQIAKRESLPKLNARKFVIAMWLGIAIFVTLALDTTLIVGE